MKTIKTLFRPSRSVKTLSLAVATVLCTLPTQLSAHGYNDSPKSRQAFCEEQGGYWWPADGANIPNLACRAAFLQSGHYPFTQKPEFAANVPDYFNQAAVEATVADGSLCAGGDANKAGIDIPSADWPHTEVTPDANGNIRLRYSADTPHNPSFWKIYLSNPGFDTATEVLKWSDLTKVQEHGDIPVVIGSDNKRYYEMDVAIPADRSGDAILFSRWQREDAGGEGFYNCSDIIIKNDGSTPTDWFPVSYYLKQGQIAAAGDVVRARVFSATGQELVNQVLDVSASNLNTWQQDLATQITTDHSAVVAIGVKDSKDAIAFDATNLATNQVWVHNDQYTFNLSIKPKPVNSAPQVTDIADISLTENTVANINVVAFDDENDPMTYTWDVPKDFNLSGSGANISVVAPIVTADTPYTLSVTVSDGVLATTKSFVVTVTNLAATEWDSGKVYVYADKVSYNGDLYMAKWWTLGETPGSAQVWVKQ